MKCAHCSQELSPGAKFCGSCGTPVPVQSPVGSPMGGGASPLTGSPLATHPGSTTHVTGFPQSSQPYNAVPGAPANSSMPGPASPFAGQMSNKSYMTTFLLSFFLGWLGADRFYTGHAALGVLKLITLGGCGLWSLIDTILILSGVRKDQYGRTLYGREKDFKVTLIIFIIFSALGTVGGAAQGFLSAWFASQDSSSVTTTSTQSSSDTGSVTPKAVGGSFDVQTDMGEKLSVTLVKVVSDAQPASSADKPASGKKLVAVQLKIQNPGTKTVSNEDAYTSATLVDTQDQTYQTSYSEAKDCQAFAANALSSFTAGETTLGCVVFEVPSGATLSKVKYTPSSGYGKSGAVWKL